MRLVLSLVVVIGGCLGAALGWVIGEMRLSNQVLLELRVSLQGNTVQVGSMDDGWGPSTTRGSPLVKAVATLLVPTLGLRNIDYVVDVEMEGELLRGEPLVEVDVSANNHLIGSMKLGATRTRRMFMPKEWVNLSLPLKFTFRSRTPPTASIQISAITLREISTLQEFAGHVDLCLGNRINGWAKSGTAPAPIIIARNGVRTLFVMQSLYRPDLKAAGMPADAGFDIILSEAIKRDEKVEVLQSNGKRLGGVECKP